MTAQHPSALPAVLSDTYRHRSAEHTAHTRHAVRPAEGTLLSTRQLNRALLARQMLLERVETPVVDLVEHLVGMQAQNPLDPYYALWSRIAEFRQEDLARLIQERRAVRMLLMRATVHLVTARDALTIRPVVQPVMDAVLGGGTDNARNLTGVDLAALAALGRALLEEQPRMMAALRPHLAERWPEHNPEYLARGVHFRLPLVQIPPRGVWGRSSRVICTTAEAWLGQPLETDTAPDAILLRYLAAFGPATVADMRTWSRLTGLREVVERLRPHLVTYRDERGRELFDLPGAPLPHADTPAPVRFLPEFDNVLLSHDDRRRVIADEHRNRPRIGQCSVLVDGYYRGAWKLTRVRGTAVLTVQPFERLTATERADLEAEGARLLSWATPEDRHELRMLPVA